ncbi:MAG: hypothetical protein AB1488_02035 [Nitrospirota bacterium]
MDQTKVCKIEGREDKMRVLKIALLSMMVLGLIFSVAFAAVDVSKENTVSIAYEEDVIFCAQNAFKSKIIDAKSTDQYCCL